MEYKIMNRERTSYSLSGGDCPKVYEKNKKYHIDEKYISYGDVLVKFRRVRSGISIKMKLFYKNHWYWKPVFMWKYGIRYFHWLFFMFWIEIEYKHVFDKVEKDHLGELLNPLKN